MPDQFGNPLPGREYEEYSARMAAKLEETRKRVEQAELELAARKIEAEDALGPEWMYIDDAPRDGSLIIGWCFKDDRHPLIMGFVWNASPDYGEPCWYMPIHAGYDMNGDEYQPTRWLPSFGA